MSKTGSGLAKWAENIYKAGTHVYWYGTYCNPCTNDLLEGKAKQYPTHYTDNRMATYKKHIQQGKIATDCNGLIEAYAWEENGVIKRNRNDIPDRSASGMYSAARYKGKITDGMPEIPGILVWTETKAHVAVYIGNGYVIEARGFSYGIPKSAMSSRNFKFWGDYAYIDYTSAEFELMKAYSKSTQTTTATKQPSGTETLRKGSTGAAVKELQTLLMKHGYDLPRYGADGDFGNETLAAVKAFQSDKGLEVDGAVGPITWAALRTENTKEPMYAVHIAGLNLAKANEIIAKYGGTKEVDTHAV